MERAPGDEVPERARPDEDQSLVLTAFLKNARSLNDDRLEELLHELSDIQWDFVVLTETWRQERQEYSILSTGDLFAGADTHHVEYHQPVWSCPSCSDLSDMVIRFRIPRHR